VDMQLSLFQTVSMFSCCMKPEFFYPSKLMQVCYIWYAHGTSEYNLVVGGFVVLVAKDQISNFVM
jgi:hypothetical protein